MKYFNFDALIDKYSVDFTVISTGDGHYDDMGEWVTGTEETTQKQGAIIGISDTKMYRSEGLLTAQDKELYMRESLGAYDNTHVVYNGNKYKVESMPHDNHEFSGVWAYTLKYVSAFGGDSAD